MAILRRARRLAVCSLLRDGSEDKSAGIGVGGIDGVSSASSVHRDWQAGDKGAGIGILVMPIGAGLERVFGVTGSVSKGCSVLLMRCILASGSGREVDIFLFKEEVGPLLNSMSSDTSDMDDAAWS